MIGTVTGRVGSVTTSAVKSLDASAKYFGCIGEILGRVGEIFGIRRRRFGRLGGTRLVASTRIPATIIFWTPRHITFIASVRSLFGEIFFQDDVYISLDSMACVI